MNKKVFEYDYVSLDRQFSILVGYQVPNDIFGIKTINTYGPESLYRDYLFLEYYHMNMIAHKPFYRRTNQSGSVKS